MATVRLLKEHKDIKELKQLALELYSYKLYVMLELGFNTGMRVMEMLPLKWTDILEEDGSIKECITIDQSFAKERRTIFFSTKLKECFTKLREENPNDIYVFHSTARGKKNKNTHYAEQYINYFFKDIGGVVRKKKMFSGTTMRNSLIYYLAPNKNKLMADMVLSYNDETEHSPELRDCIKAIYERIRL